MVDIGARLREERERLRLNQTDFSALGKAAKRAQVRYEAGERSPDLEYLAGIAAVGADVLYIVTGERRTSPPASFQPMKLRQVVKGVEEALRGKRLRLTPSKKAELVTLLYEHFSSLDRVERSTVERYLRLVA